METPLNIRWSTPIKKESNKNVFINNLQACFIEFVLLIIIQLQLWGQTVALFLNTWSDTIMYFPLAYQPAYSPVGGTLPLHIIFVFLYICCLSWWNFSFSFMLSDRLEVTWCCFNSTVPLGQALALFTITSLLSVAPGPLFSWKVLWTPSQMALQALQKDDRCLLFSKRFSADIFSLDVLQPTYCITRGGKKKKKKRLPLWFCVYRRWMPDAFCCWQSEGRHWRKVTHNLW